MYFYFEKRFTGFGKVNYYIVGEPNENPLITIKGDIKNNNTFTYDDGQDRFEMFLGKLYSNIKKDGKISRKDAGDVNINGKDEIIYEYTKTGTNIFNGYRYFGFKFGFDDIEAITVGFNRKGLYLCIYVNGILKAIVDKEQEVYAYEPKYEIYAEDDVNKAMLFLATAYWDAAYWHQESARQTMVYSTLSEEARAKYDPNFIPRIQSMRGME